MANIDIKEPVYSGTEINRLAKDIEEKVKGEKYQYPVLINYMTGEIIRLDKKCLVPVGPEKKLETLPGHSVQTYEFLAPDGTTQKIELAVMKNPVGSTLLKHASEVMQYAEALRKTANLFIMSGPEISLLKGNPNVGVLFADKLINYQGFSISAETEIRSCLGSNIPNSIVNKALNDHKDNRTLVYMKDRYLSAVLGQYAEGCLELSKAIEAAQSLAPVLDIQSTGSAVTVVNETPAKVQEIMTPEPKKDEFKSIM